LEIVSKDSIDIEIDFVDDSPSKRDCQKSWAQLIYKIYEVGPLLCPKCGKRMKFIAFIQDYVEIKKILKHLGLLLEFSNYHQFRKVLHMISIQCPQILACFPKCCGFFHIEFRRLKYYEIRQKTIGLSVTVN
jgi:hypothetical protein